MKVFDDPSLFFVGQFIGDEGFEIPKTYTFKLDQKYIDVETGDYVEGIITLPPRSGKILLKRPQL